MICGVTGEHWRSLHEANLVKKAVQKRDARIAELEARLEITPDCQYDGIDTRDATIKNLEQQIANYEMARRDKDRLVRELDVLLNGDAAAKQASLCDIVAQVRLTLSQLADERERCARICDGCRV